MNKTKTTTNMKIRHDAIFQGDLILVNKRHSVRCTVDVGLLVEVAPQIWLKKTPALLFEAVIKKIEATDEIIPVSGYRTKKEQEEIFAETLCERGEVYTRTYVALPDCSEHQTGLAIDLGKKAGSIDFIAPGFPYFGICKTFRKQAIQYGFIERYPKGKETVTGIGHEPWHFRYVGMPHAQLMTYLDLTLEEYICWIKKHPYHKNAYVFETQAYSYKIGYLPASDEKTTSIEMEEELFSISGNNIDGFILVGRQVQHEK